MTIKELMKKYGDGKYIIETQENIYIYIYIYGKLRNDGIYVIYSL